MSIIVKIVKICSFSYKKWYDKTIFKSNNILERKVLLELVNTNTLGKKLFNQNLNRTIPKFWIYCTLQYKVRQYTKQYSTYNVFYEQ